MFQSHEGSARLEILGYLNESDRANALVKFTTDKERELTQILKVQLAEKTTQLILPVLVCVCARLCLLSTFIS